MPFDLRRIVNDLSNQSRDSVMVQTPQGAGQRDPSSPFARFTQGQQFPVASPMQGPPGFPQMQSFGPYGLLAQQMAGMSPGMSQRIGMKNRQPMPFSFGAQNPYAGMLPNFNAGLLNG